MLRPCVAIFDSTADTVEMLALVFREAGFRVVDAHVSDVKRGLHDFMDFMVVNDPHVIVWDIAPPYEQNWTFFKLLRSSDAVKGRGMVVTTTHKRHLDALAGHDTDAIEIVGKPYDLGLILAAVQHAAAQVTDEREKILRRA